MQYMGGGAKSGKIHDHALLTHVNPYKPFTNSPLAFLVFCNLITTKKFNNMIFIHLIMFFDFIKVLNSARKFYTKN
jgi:hypothetical protein